MPCQNIKYALGEYQKSIVGQLQALNGSLTLSQIFSKNKKLGAGKESFNKYSNVFIIKWTKYYGTN